jgi:ribosomal protein S18 acetylase RimI-like enzyme
MSETAVTVRLADLNDAADRVAFGAMLGMYHADAMGAGVEPPAGLVEQVANDLAANQRGRATCVLALAFVGDEVAGYALCFEAYSSFAGAPVINLHDVAVAPFCRGRGVVSQLFACVEAEARRRGCAKLTLEVRDDNEPARRAYARLGFADADPPQRFWSKQLD